MKMIIKMSNKYKKSKILVIIYNKNNNKYNKK